MVLFQDGRIRPFLFRVKGKVRILSQVACDIPRFRVIDHVAVRRLVFAGSALDFSQALPESDNLLSRGTPRLRVELDQAVFYRRPKAGGNTRLDHIYIVTWLREPLFKIVSALGVWKLI